MVVLRELRVSFDEFVAERPQAVADDDVRFAESLAGALISEFTEPGALVFDPFAGYGTTLVVAQRLGRRAIGVELLPDRAAISRRRVGPSVPVLVGDIRNRLDDVPRALDLCLTSPPYMTATDHPENPLTGYRSSDGNYASYLVELAGIFRDIGRRMCEGGRLIVNVADQDAGGVRTTLVTDVAAAVSRHLQPVQEIPVRWDHTPVGISNDTCLVFAAL